MSTFEVHVIATVNDVLDEQEAKSAVYEALDDAFIDCEVKGVLEVASN